MLGEALKGERRESLEIFTKVYWPTGPGGQERHRPVAQAHHRVDQRLAAAARRPTTSTSTRRTATTPRRRSRRRCRPSPTSSRQGKALYIGVSEWTAEQIRAGHALAERARHPADLEPAAVLDAVAGHRGRGRPDLRGARHQPDRLVARSRRACSPASTSPASSRPEGSRATDEKGGADMIKRFMNDDVLDPGAAAQADRRRAGLTMAQLAVAWVLQNHNVAAALVGASRPEQVAENVKAAGVKLEPELHEADRRRRSATSSSATRARPRRTRPRGASPDARSLSGASPPRAYAVRRVPMGRAGRHTPSCLTRAATVAPWSGWWGRRRASRTSRSASCGSSCATATDDTVPHPERAPDIGPEGPRARRRRAHAGRRRRGRRGQGRQRLGRPAGTVVDRRRHAAQPHPPGRPVPRRQVRPARRSSRATRGGRHRHSRVRWGHAIVVPYTDVADDFATRDCPRWMISGRGDLDDLAGRLRDVCALQENDQRVPNAEDVELILEILTGRSFPVYDLAGEADEREAAADRLTQEQAALLPGHAAHQAHGDPRGSRQREDDPGPDPGQGPHPRSGRAQGAAGGTRLLLDRALAVLQATARRGAAPAPAGVRRVLRGARQRVGHRHGVARPQRRRLLGARSRGPDDRDRRGPAGRQEVRRRHRRRGAGLRRPLVAPAHEGAARRGRGRSLRLLGREPADLRPLRPAAGAARPARARPQPAQHPADRSGVRAARPHADAPARGTGRRRSASCPALGRTAIAAPTTRWTCSSRRAGSRSTSRC